MEYLIDLLEDLVGDPARVRVAFVALVALTVFVVGLALTVLVAGATSPLRRRVEQAVGPAAAGAGAMAGLNRMLDSAAPIVTPRKEGERVRVRTRMIHAGYRSPNAITAFFTVKLLLGIMLPVAVLLGASQFPYYTTYQVGVAALVASFLGMMIPNLYLGKRVEKRQRALRNGFPDALDMLVVCVEAGLGLNAAIQRVTAELSVSHPELASELGLVNAEIRAGVDRVQALRNLADRTGLPDIRGLVALLAQSLRFGTSVAETLRVYAEEFRDKRMQRAEEQAAKIGTKLLFPLVFCLFPGFFLVAIGPALLGVMNALAAR